MEASRTKLLHPILGEREGPVDARSPEALNRTKGWFLRQAAGAPTLARRRAPDETSSLSQFPSANAGGCSNSLTRTTLWR